LGLGASLEAAECQAVAPFTPAAPTVAPLGGTEATDILALNPLSSAVEMAPPPDDCSHIACIQTPEGCGCDGFWCGPIFICGIPWH
ncbi:MAG TPA: hypothetical protein VG477_07520, partial [Thermoanaerobaculia bacterium]|nr:hypothetical protein [Thermoanaerobaculia bacterium]